MRSSDIISMVVVVVVATSIIPMAIGATESGLLTELQEVQIGEDLDSDIRIQCNLELSNMRDRYTEEIRACEDRDDGFNYEYLLLLPIGAYFGFWLGRKVGRDEGKKRRRTSSHRW